jgi:tRNA (guanosine-2'-O-)-methyltransferase
MTPERLEKIQEVAANRQLDLTVVLENTHDPHNISAVLRSCDAVGIAEIFILYTDPVLKDKSIKLGKKTAGGATKWVDVQFYNDFEKCYRNIKKKYNQILVSSLEKQALSIYDLDLTRSLALVFGNEHSGVSDAFLEKADGFFTIPQAGMVQSLNISVACAVTLYESMRQRLLSGRIGLPKAEADPNLLKKYKDIHQSGTTPKVFYPK